MKNFYQLRLGRGAKYFAECLNEGFVGVDWFKDVDLTTLLNDSLEWRAFNREMIPVYLKEYPDKKKLQRV